MAGPSYLTPEEFFAIGIGSEAFKQTATTVVASAIAAASDTADSYFRKRHALPFVPETVGGDIKRAVASLVQWDLLCRRGFRPDSAQDVVSRSRFDDAIDWLTAVSKGTVEVSATDSTPTVDEDGPIAVSSQPAANFSMTTGRRGRGLCCDED